ncbi:Site-specific DNA recombinase [Lentzea albidocapillata subsp. violacea]|uniref:Site-specific DNA recombinase n=1 Tax=Lentzea albidocapillata subsp. violacea TaxID=128104 RepID=A0A1G9YQ56_9PSEU|nr:recombinase family protein [Lentzea albidocapillata]SDN11359.1 Site-specific DNA recombinase [Lentzea albidocapillata subsp. violacea]
MTTSFDSAATPYGAAVRTTGLSDLAVSPFGMPVSLLYGEVRVAWLGRTSTHERQDPRQSLIRQLERCRGAVPDAWVIVCHFYDVESGRMELDQRGHGTGYDRFDIPIARDGGMADLLDEAQHSSRRFDVVICESTSRVARRMYEGLSVERALDKGGVPLFAWNEPIKLDGSRAQQVLQRRINQAVAEYEVLNTLELSWGGLCTHVREGWNIGKPPYGYKGKTYRHPNPAKAEKGLTKTRLEPDGVRAATVTQIASWRYYEGLGYGVIAERLNADLASYPPPEPPGKARARGLWSKSSVSGVLCNPKYAGYQVFNRRATRSKRGKVNPPSHWVWSHEPAHEPLIPKWMFDEITASRQSNRGTRSEATLQAQPQTKRAYALKGMVFCNCGRRMHGNQKRGLVYYTCWPRDNNRGRKGLHPPGNEAVYIREEAILRAAASLLAEQVFVPELATMLQAAGGESDQNTSCGVVTQQEWWRRRMATLERQQHNLLHQARNCAPDDPFTAALRTSYNDLESQKTATAAEIASFESVAGQESLREQDVSVVIERLAGLRDCLVRAPAPLLRRLFEAIQLTVHLHDYNGQATISIQIPTLA